MYTRLPHYHSKIPPDVRARGHWRTEGHARTPSGFCPKNCALSWADISKCACACHTTILQAGQACKRENTGGQRDTGGHCPGSALKIVPHPGLRSQNVYAHATLLFYKPGRRTSDRTLEDERGRGRTLSEFCPKIVPYPGLTSQNVHALATQPFYKPGRRTSERTLEDRRGRRRTRSRLCPKNCALAVVSACKRLRWL